MRSLLTVVTVISDSESPDVIANVIVLMFINEIKQMKSGSMAPGDPTTIKMGNDSPWPPPWRVGSAKNIFNF